MYVSHVLSIKMRSSAVRTAFLIIHFFHEVSRHWDPSKSRGARKIRHIPGRTDDNPSHNSRILFQTQNAEFLVLTTHMQGFVGQQ
jgi:hypothetical protein